MLVVSLLQRNPHYHQRYLSTSSLQHVISVALLSQIYSLSSYTRSISSSAIVTSSTKNETTTTTITTEKDHLVKEYQRLVDKGDVSFDVHQIQALQSLDRLRYELITRPTPTTTSTNATKQNNTNSFWQGLSNIFSSASSPPSRPQSSSSPPPPRGIYLHGGVGCGKTFCMNLFYSSLPSHLINKQKVHFHKFMLAIHSHIHQTKMIHKRTTADPLPHVISAIAQSGTMICFDEFQVTDVADALILRRLFEGLWGRGCTVVATSNRPPRDLYLNGIQRDLFLPFVDALEERCEVVGMWESDVDYRLVAAAAASEEGGGGGGSGRRRRRGVYFVGEEGRKAFREVFGTLTKNSTISPTVLFTQGRRINIPKASNEYKVARFDFDDVCRKATGAADYLAIGEHFHTVFVENVPRLTLNDVNVVRRFIIFVDAMYECKVKLILHAEVGVGGIFEVDLENEAFDEVFAFDRTRSRLEEMGSDKYLRERWLGKSDKVIDEVFGNDEVLLFDIGDKKKKRDT